MEGERHWKFCRRYKILCHIPRSGKIVDSLVSVASKTSTKFYLALGYIPLFECQKFRVLHPSRCPQVLDTGVWSNIPQHPLSFVTVSKFQSVLSVEVDKNTLVVPLVYSIHPFMKRQNFMMVCPSSWPRCYVVETEILTLVLPVWYTCMYASSNMCWWQYECDEI